MYDELRARQDSPFGVRVDESPPAWYERVWVGDQLQGVQDVYLPGDTGYSRPHREPLTLDEINAIIEQVASAVRGTGRY